MTSLVVDTHIVIWYLTNPSKLSLAAVNALDNAFRGGHTVYLSAISIVEMVYLVEKDRIPNLVLEQVLELFDDGQSGLEVIPLSLAITLALTEIPRSVVPEMGDRIIAATAWHSALPLVTNDQKIRALTNQTII